MIVVITPEESVRNETEIINELFQEGLELLHIRKPSVNLEAMMNFIQNINPEFHHRLVLHNHYELAKDFHISRLHFREADRENGIYESFKNKIISTSVHDLETFNGLSGIWEYAFISPVFPSISKKGYGENSTVLKDIEKRENTDVKMIALGGINAENISKVFKYGADGASLLGAIWESNEPIEIFKKCRQNALS